MYDVCMMYVCIYVCMMYVYMYICIYVIALYVCMYVCIYICMYVHIIHTIKCHFKFILSSVKHHNMIPYHTIPTLLKLRFFTIFGV